MLDNILSANLLSIPLPASSLSFLLIFPSSHNVSTLELSKPLISAEAPFPPTSLFSTVAACISLLSKARVLWTSFPYVSSRLTFGATASGAVNAAPERSLVIPASFMKYSGAPTQPMFLVWSSIRFLNLASVLLLATETCLLSSDIYLRSSSPIFIDLYACDTFSVSFVGSPVPFRISTTAIKAPSWPVFASPLYMPSEIFWMALMCAW